MATKVTIGYIDFSNEKSSWSVEGVALSAANYDAQQTLIGTMRTAAEALLIGSLDKTTVSSLTDHAGSTPVLGAAQRELKLRITYKDDTDGRVFQTTLPCPDTEHAGKVSGTDIWNIEETDVAAFVTAFEAYVLAPGTGNSVTVQEVRLVGRRV